MGIYINPTTDTDARMKRDTILAIATHATKAEFLAHAPGSDDKWGVAILDNGLFVAAGVAYSANEARVFVEGAGGRPLDLVFLTMAQIESLDPAAAADLQRTSLKVA